MNSFIVSRKNLILILFELSLLLCAIVINNPIVYTICSLICWIVNFFYCLFNQKKHFSLLAFNVGYFVFILGGYTTSLIINHNFVYFTNSYFTSSEVAILHASKCVLLCLILVNCSYFYLNKSTISDKKIGSITLKDSNIPRMLKQIIVMMLILSYFCQLLGAFETYNLVKRVTYYASDNYLSSLPSVLQYTASLYYIALFMYWALLPDKKKTIFSFITLGFLELIILMSGERGEPISALFVTVFYIYYRNRHNINDIKISKKMLIVGILLIPIFMTGLETLSYSRDQKEYDVSITQSVEDFLESQGGSVKIIANAYDLDYDIEMLVNGKRSFVLGELRYYLKNNVFARLFTGKKVRLRNIEDAQSGDNFLRSYGYTYASTSYLNGVGSGSTYIAEVFYDGGYLLLVIVNIAIGLFLCRFDNVHSIGIIKFSIIFNIFRYIPLLPRGMMLDWFTNTFAIQNILVFLFLYIFIIKEGRNNENSIYNNGVSIK